jgi:hypothetical protein
MSLLSLPVRQDLHDLFSHCEGLLGKALQPDHAPFSQDELQMICYYANQIAKLADSQRLRAEHGKPTTLAPSCF